MSLILGIETSCDECSASIVKYTTEHCEVVSLETFSQIELHKPYGGVVPEIASRNHLETVIPIIEAALKSANLTMDAIDAIAVTNRPGLVGALLVGVSAAKSLAYAFKKPLVPVHHLEGHLASIFLNRAGNTPVERNALQYPMLSLLVSGGHSQLHHLDAPPELWTPG
ncbi:MAG: tRNA (adenosine(37)-N6)-threonylcarbamoyltransferase complex transferase subunit TsaD, partial [Proteobacteria bacterium]